MTATKRDSYVRTFLQAARPVIVDDLARWAASLETLDIDYATDTPAYATATVRFRGRRFTYRQQIWPTDHPAALRAALYSTTLTERLLTKPPPAESDP
ncbi:MAG: hypothetical protein ACJ72N_13315 [Labedaea sp.]